MRYSFSILALFVCQSVLSQPYFSRYYSLDSPFSGFHDVLIENDTLVAYSFIRQTEEPFLQGVSLTKMDSNGNIIQIQRFFDPLGRHLSYNPVTRMTRTSEGGYATVGIVFGAPEVFLLTWTHRGIPDKYFTFLDTTLFFTSLKKAINIDSVFYLVGGVQLSNYTTQNIVYKVNDDGVLLWKKSYGLHNKDEFPGDAVVLSDTSLVICSLRKPFPTLSDDRRQNTWIFKIDLEGNLLNEFIDPDPFSGTSGGVVLDAKNEIYYTGTEITVGPLDEHNGLGRIGKLSSDFDLQWKRTYGKNLSLSTGCSDMILTGNQLVAVGTHVDTFTTVQGTRRPHLGWTIVASIEGDSICERFDTAMWYLPISAISRLYGIDTLSSGNIIACGEGRFGPDTDPHDYAWLVKMPNPPCEGTLVSTTEFRRDITTALTIVPNPSDGNITIHLNDDVQLDAEYLLLFDTQGRLVEKKDWMPADKGVSFDMNEVPPGTYVIQLISRYGYLLGVDKLVIQK